MSTTEAVLQLCEIGWGDWWSTCRFLEERENPGKNSLPWKTNQFIDRWPIDDTVILCILMHKLTNEWAKWHRYLERKDEAAVKNKRSFTFKNIAEP